MKFDFKKKMYELYDSISFDENSKYYPAPLDVLAVVGLLVAAWAWMWLVC